MNKKLIEIIDETIENISKHINELLSDKDENNRNIYLNESIKALAELISARALLENSARCGHSVSDELSRE